MKESPKHTQTIKKDLEEFCYDKAAKVAIKFGFAGLGQMGGKIADMFEAISDSHGRKFYQSVAINSYYGDLSPLENIPDDRRLQLEGGEGCGRKPELCMELLRNKHNQMQIIEYIEKYLKDNHMYVVVAGLGGGTGTGLVVPMIKTINHHINAPLINEQKRPKPIGAIVAIPRASEPLIEKRNAVKALEELKVLLNKGQLRFLMIIDNEKAFKDYREQRAEGQNEYENWMDYSNINFVKSFHELNLGICYPGNKNFDPRDLRNIFEDNPGCLSLSKLVVQASDIERQSDIIPKINDCLHNKNVLANGFNFKNARQAGFLLVTPKNNDISSDLMDDIDLKLYEEMPETITRPGSCIKWKEDENKFIIYTIAKVTEYPERARSGIQEELSNATSSISEKIQTEKIDTKKCIFNDNIFTGGSMDTDFDNPFSNDLFSAATSEEEDLSLLYEDFDKK